MNNRRLKQLLSLFIIVLLGKQLIASSNLLQADQIKYDQDMALIGRIESQLDRLNINPEKSKLMIVGYHNNKTPLNIQEELLGESMFQFGDFTGNTNAMTYNVVSLMNQNGYNINAVSNYQFKKEFGRSKSMRVFPEKDSIKVKDNLVIVKLS